MRRTQEKRCDATREISVNVFLALFSQVNDKKKVKKGFWRREKPRKREERDALDFSFLHLLHAVHLSLLPASCRPGFRHRTLWRLYPLHDHYLRNRQRPASVLPRGARIFGVVEFRAARSSLFKKISYFGPLYFSTSILLVPRWDYYSGSCA